MVRMAAMKVTEISFPVRLYAPSIIITSCISAATATAPKRKRKRYAM